MVKIYKLFCLSFFVLIGNLLFAQQNSTLKVVVTSPAYLAGTYNAVSGGFGTILNIGDTISGNLIPVNDGSPTPLLGCNALTNAAAVNGNIALIKRGDCEFGVKCMNAELAGAKAAVVFNRLSGGPIVMGAGAVGDSVKIPVCMISLEDGEKLVDAINNGVNVTISLIIPYFYRPLGSWSYAEPLSKSVEFQPVVNFANINKSNLANLEIKARITEPDGNYVNLTRSLSDLAVSKDSVVFFDNYLPKQLGKYEIKFSNNIDKDTLVTYFERSKSKFALDNFNSDYVFSTSNDGITVDATTFSNLGGRFDMGVKYRPGVNTKISYASFALTNIESFPDNEAFTVIVYKMADAGQDPNGNTSSYDDFTFVSASEYIKKSTDKNNTALFVELLNSDGNGPVDLEAEVPYLIVVKYENGLNTTNPPKFTYSSQIQYFDSNETVWGLDGNNNPRLFLGGYEGEYNIVIRMYTNDFIIGVKDLPSYEEHQLTVNPNPADSYINVGFDFNELTAEVKTAVVDANGKIVRTKKYENVQKNSFVEDVTDLSPGTYFYSIITKNGWGVKPFIVVSNSSK